jgi:hypothetical protein
MILRCRSLFIVSVKLCTLQNFDQFMVNLTEFILVFVELVEQFFKHFKNIFWVLMVAFVVLIEQDASRG